MARREQFTVGELHLIGVSDGAVTVFVRDSDGKIAMCGGATIPADGGAGYAIGCEFSKSNAANGQYVTWVNHGTTTSCAFRPHEGVINYGFAYGGGSIACTSGVTAFTTPIPEIRASDISFVAYQVSDDTDNILAQIAANGSIGATLSADPLAAHGVNVAALRSGCIPMYDIFAAGKHTTVGGHTYEDITVTGVNSSDLVFATYSVSDDSDTIAKAAYQTTDTIRVTMSADPLTAHELSYIVLRPRGSFKPSHYVFAAGVHITVGGATAEAITVSGMLATDIPIVYYNTTDDTDTIVKAVPTAGTLTVTMSADPSTTHKLAYMLLRAY